MNRLGIGLFVGLTAIMSSVHAHAADLIIDEPAMPGVVEMTGEWDGVYLGGFVGYGFGENSAAGFDPNELSGFLVGASIGANFTVTDGIVAGIVGDVAWSNVGFDEEGEYSFQVDWLGSVRGRLGFDGGSFMPYLTAGVAFASGEAHIYNDYVGPNQLHVGWTVGAGVEIAVTEDVSLDLLYRYSDLGEQTYQFPGDYPESLTMSTIQAGLNWKF